MLRNELLQDETQWRPTVADILLEDFPDREVRGQKIAIGEASFKYLRSITCSSTVLQVLKTALDSIVQLVGIFSLILDRKICLQPALELPRVN